MSRDQLIRHLEFFGDLAVSGVSHDASWSRRRSAAPASGPVQVEPSPPVGPTDEEGSDRARPGMAEEGSARPTPAAGVQGPARDTVAPGTTLEVVRTALGDCTRCKLHTLGRQQIVFGVGNPSADLMFVGEAPGHDEDIQGIPFVGRAGQLLTRIIEAIGLSRDDVYIANVIKCRPPQNRNPEPDEVAACEPFLFAQVDVIQPKVIVALGTFAARALLRTDETISRLRGRVYQYRGARLVPTFHPAYLLRSPDRKRDTWEDMKKVRAMLSGEE